MLPTFRPRVDFIKSERTAPGTAQSEGPTNEKLFLASKFGIGVGIIN